MTRNRLVGCAGALVVLATVASTTVVGQPFDKRTFFTFSGPTAIPGMTLPAGKYLFRVMKSTSREVIQVLSPDGVRPYSMFFAIRALRNDVPEKPEVRFMETARGMPAAVDTMWYPGESTGYEFIYPKEQARRLARGVAQPVLTTRAETTTPAETNIPELSRVTPSAEVVVLEGEPDAEAPSGVSQVGEIAPPTLELAPLPALQARAELPKTGSTTPLLFLAGLTLLLGGATVRVLRGVRA